MQRTVQSAMLVAVYLQTTLENVPLKRKFTFGIKLVGELQTDYQHIRIRFARYGEAAKFKGLFC